MKLYLHVLSRKKGRENSVKKNRSPTQCPIFENDQYVEWRNSTPFFYIKIYISLSENQIASHRLQSHEPIIPLYYNIDFLNIYRLKNCHLIKKEKKSITNNRFLRKLSMGHIMYVYDYWVLYL